MTEITRHHITSGDLDITINANGSVARIKSGDMQVSQYVPGIHDAGIAGVWLRRRDGENIESIPLTGFESASRCSFGGGTATWSGNGLGVDWTAKLVIIDSNEWAWNVTANPSANGGAGDYEWDLVVAQDLALAPVEQALTSEPYISQYIAYHVENDDKYGKVLVARQTMSAAPKLPSFTMMIAEGASAWLTDGFDFYGRTARAGEQPVALTDPDWGGGRTNQFEFGMACLLSKPRSLGEGLQWTILNHFDADDRNEMSDICTATVEKVENILDRLDLDLVDFADSTEIKLPDDASILAKAPALNGDELDEQALLPIGGGKATSPERNGEGKTLSYFSDHARHVVSGEKEMNVDRSHGQILLAGGVTDPSVPAFAATTYAPGVFASHIVLGNTNMNRLVSVHRTSLNLLRSQGVRILVRLSGRDDETWRMLSVPSAYVMDLGGSRWVYQIGDERIVVETVASSVESAMDIALTSTCEIDALMTIDIENPEQWALESSDNCVTMIPAQGTLAAECCAQLGYAFTSDGDSNYVETETMPSFVACTSPSPPARKAELRPHLRGPPRTRSMRSTLTRSWNVTLESSPSTSPISTSPTTTSSRNSTSACRGSFRTPWCISCPPTVWSSIPEPHGERETYARDRSRWPLRSDISTPREPSSAKCSRIRTRMAHCRNGSCSTSTRPSTSMIPTATSPYGR